ncbi:uncharacterized protein LOC127702366 isoform X2 [Mytilus californianus]|uniref:uncharacterized protein LOC127702366 isoform X2 n=1 Tax=Mytilus californianus TaxID=6549 RepID=UPI002247D4A7|nr:uncharacterized protein LOC127702366 isoform X2 [Mytilus californianus]
MGKVCVVLGCRNRDSHKQPGIKFHRIPKDEERKQLWIKAINRRDPLTGKVWISGDEGARVCSVSEHFIDGKCDDPKSPDYVPSLKMGYGNCDVNAVSSSKSVDRYKRAVKRTADQKERECRMQLDLLMTADGKENDHLPLQDLDCNVDMEDKNGTRT